MKFKYTKKRTPYTNCNNFNYTIKFNNAVGFAKSVHRHASVTTEIIGADIGNVQNHFANVAVSDFFINEPGTCKPSNDFNINFNIRCAMKTVSVRLDLEL